MAIFEAVRNKDLSFVYTYLADGGDPSVVDENGNGLMHTAIYEDRLGSLRVMLDWGVSTELEDEYGNKPLQVAVMYNNLNAASMLLLAGADIDGTSSERPWTPLMIALNDKLTDMAIWLMSKGANTDFVEQDEGWTPLLIACENSLKDLSLEIIDKGAHIGATLTSGDIAGRSALHLVAYHGEVDLARVLVERGIDVNTKPVGGGLSALHWAVYNDHQPLVEYLLEAGADPNMPAAGIYDDRTPLHYAVACRRGHLLPSLLSHEADPLQPDIQGRTPLDLAWQFYREGRKRIYRDILSLLENYA